MKLRELLKRYYDSPKEVTMGSSAIRHAFHELVLPGTYDSLSSYKKDLVWNLDQDVYYREATKQEGSDELYVTMTTGRMTFYFVFDSDSEFQELLDAGLKKHRSYRKDFLSWEKGKKYLFYSRKYE